MCAFKIFSTTSNKDPKISYNPIYDTDHQLVDGYTIIRSTRTDRVSFIVSLNSDGSISFYMISDVPEYMLNYNQVECFKSFFTGETQKLVMAVPTYGPNSGGTTSVAATVASTVASNNIQGPGYNGDGGK
jgi:hypothetical protein